MLAKARKYFDDHGVLEVDTPTLGFATTTEPQITSIRTEDGLYLQSSPEFFMKRLLAAGYPDIYSICHVHRGAESGRRHLLEFTMIEWYRQAMKLSEIIDDTTSLIATILGGQNLLHSIRKRNYRDLYTELLRMDPLDASIDELASACGAEVSLRAAIGDDRSAWLDLILTTRIAPTFAADTLTIVQHYPAVQAALSRLCPDDPKYADRFEVFYGETELANGYVELTDAAEQAERMRADLQIRKAMGKDTVPVDAHLIAALESGIPECAGVALGFERLHMIVENCDDIRQLITFTDDC